MHGTVTLGAEVTNVSTHCFWLLLGDEELAVPFTDFPWFKKATIEQLSDVQRPTEDHLYWPQLDVDLSVESIRKPESFPLVSRSDAVGTGITPRPPHRSVRAELPHTAPASGADDQPPPK